ncbi:unnamed protein product [Ostreobium quekettii]|uniref:Peptidase S1 domain-containing protein n=1 Tax=Ostreobium quekettii TaxID=121088 RepID=A0A8S1JIM5_9CHLO|nr:unnamed protein product [Ostreobium quekettii]|eukprot:evm.model.scf_23.11 EVM.evm.TU.scf_23.11   scf_23:97038-99452(-)
MRSPPRLSPSSLPLPLLPIAIPLILCISFCTTSSCSRVDLQRGTTANDGLTLSGRSLAQDEFKGDDLPFVASLRDGGEHFCGGVLVAPDLVVTGASCVTTRGRGHPNVRIGFDEAGGNGASEEEFETCRTIVHGGFDADRLQDGNDLALLVLNGSSAARTADLGTAGEGAGGELLLAGFRQALGQREVEFRVERMAYVANDECQALWEDHLGIADLMLGNTDNLLCASSIDGLAACRGDTGNPVVTADGQTLVGVVSFGPPNCFSVEIPSVSARVSAFLDFIEERGDRQAVVTDNPDCSA